MKYRIKEYQWYRGSKYVPQFKFLGLFWKSFEDAYEGVYEFNTLEEASICIKAMQHNKNVKKVIHNYEN